MRRLLIPLFICAFQYICGEGYFPSAKYTSYEGLSASEITDLAISSDEFLWIATTNGLNRYDGYSFRNYITDPADTNTLPNDKIQKIRCDDQGNIYGITNSLLFCIEKRRGRLSYYLIDDDKQSKDNSLEISDFQIIDGQIFLVGNSFFGSIDIKRKTNKNYLNELKHAEFQPFNYKSLCYHKATHNLVLSTTDQIISYNLTDKTFRLIAQSLLVESKKDGGIREIIPGIYSDCYVYSKHRIWKIDLQTDQCRLIYDNGNDNQVNSINKVLLDQKGYLMILEGEKIINYDLYKSLVTSEYVLELNQNQKINISSFLFDNAGILWIGTDKGLFKFIPQKNTFNTVYKTDFDKSVGLNYAGFIDKYTGLAFLQSGKVLKFINPGKGKIAVSTFKNIDSEIHSVSNTNGDFLISTSDGLLIWKDYQRDRSGFVIENKQFQGQDINAACFDSADSIWFVSKSCVYITTAKSVSPVEFKALSGKFSNILIRSITCNENFLWLQGDRNIVEYNRKSGGISRIEFTEHKWPVINSILSFDKNKLYIGTSDGLYEYSADDRKVRAIDQTFRLNRACVFSLVKTNSNKIWVSTDRGIVLFDPQTGKERLYDATDGLFFERFKERFCSLSPEDLVLFGGVDAMVIYHPDSIIVNRHIPNIEITQITVFNDKGFKNSLSDFGDTLEINYLKNHVRINFAALDFWAPQKNNFLYSLVNTGDSPNWQNIKEQNFVDINMLRPGTYTLSIKGMNNDGYWNEQSKELIIEIKQSFWRSKLAYLIYIVVIAGLFYLSVVFRTKHFRNLSRKFKEREFISKQIQLQKDELSFKNKNITDSLNYAKRIQMAMMPPQKLLKKYFNDSFILHVSKDIVSGDFYWINEVEERIYFAAVDCTGHGVPGAFMSIIGFELLRRITETDKMKQPALILDSLSLGFEKIFRDIENFTLRDGMDIAFCAIDKDMKVLEYAGAFNPLYLIRDNTIIEIKGDRFSVGLNVEGSENHFKNNVIPLNKGDIIYIFTDGFADQFGGPEGKKYKYRRFRHLLLALHQLPMERQAEFLTRSINDWRGELDQVDDILVMGIRIS